jgi:hypothetical protein
MDLCDLRSLFSHWRNSLNSKWAELLRGHIEAAWLNRLPLALIMAAQKAAVSTNSYVKAARCLHLGFSRSPIWEEDCNSELGLLAESTHVKKCLRGICQIYLRRTDLTVLRATNGNARPPPPRGRFEKSRTVN